MDALWKLRLAPQNRNALMIQQQQITRYNAQVAAHNRRRLRILKEEWRGKVEQKKYIAKSLPTFQPSDNRAHSLKRCDKSEQSLVSIIKNNQIR